MPWHYDSMGVESSCSSAPYLTDHFMYFQCMILAVIFMPLRI